MAHTTRKGSTVFIHDTDIINSMIEIRNQQGTLLVDGRNLVAFVIEHLKNVKITEIEDMNCEDFINRFVI